MHQKLRPFQTLMLGVAAGGLVTGGLIFGVFGASAGTANTVYFGCLSGGTLSKVATTAPKCKAPAKQISWNSQGVPGNPGTNFLTSSTAPTGSCTSGDSDMALDTDEIWNCVASAWSDTGSSTQGKQGPPGPSGLIPISASLIASQSAFENIPIGTTGLLDFECETLGNEPTDQFGFFDEHGGYSVSWFYGNGTTTTSGAASYASNTLSQLFNYTNAPVEGDWTFEDANNIVTLNATASYASTTNTCTITGTASVVPTS
jgi:hypothetical protein